MSPTAISTEKPVRVLPADVYDTLELAALAFGGIAEGVPYARTEDGQKVPRCAWALVEFSGIVQKYSGEQYIPTPTLPFNGDISHDGMLGYPSSDLAVQRIKERKDVRDYDARVTFAEWAAELGVIRGG